MTTLDDRPHAALLVIDVQRGVVGDAYDRDAVVARIAELVRRTRDQEALVIWVQHNSDELPRGSEQWQIVDELHRHEDEPLIEKRYGDAFEQTDLETMLARHKIGTLLVCGAQTDACVRSTLHGALVRGYDTILIGDAHTTSDLSDYGAPPPAQVVAHTNLYWNYQRAPGRRAGTILAADVDFNAEDCGASEVLVTE